MEVMLDPGAEGRLRSSGTNPIHSVSIEEPGNCSRIPCLAQWQPNLFEISLKYEPKPPTVRAKGLPWTFPSDFHRNESFKTSGGGKLTQ